MSDAGPFPSQVDVAVVGAGAAGIAATRALRAAGATVVLLEASHRIGGRAYTEEIAPGVYFDLGCHWMHSASLNPMVAFADRHGFGYIQDSWARALHSGGRFLGETELQAYGEFCERFHRQAVAAAAAGSDEAASDVTDRDERWSPVWDYWFSIINAVDPDQCSVADVAGYLDTGENWPLREGYGNLLTAIAADVPVVLNACVERIHHGQTPMRLETVRGDLRARRVLLTVSTGILAAGDIDFRPALPDWKLAAIAGLPLGNHNRICLKLSGNPFGPDHMPGVTVQRDGTEPMGFQLRPFGFDYVVGFTGGRFSTWLERAGIDAAVDLATENLAQVFGNGIRRHIVGHDVTAWGGDPWVKGAYSGALPGHGRPRDVLARDIDARLFFAGEATHVDFFSTCHGAWLSGERAAAEVLESLSGLGTGAGADRAGASES